ncbi:MAG: DUF433 domain-containing protein [Chloroflexota bacterium]|nr:DUF433 domain-containing protein [Chloroflexota bacterium]
MRQTLDTPYVVTDPEICHGKITFRGTRVLVADVLNAVAKSRDICFMGEDWHNLPQPAIAEAVRLANQALEEYAEEYVVEYGLEKVPA